MKGSKLVSERAFQHDHAILDVFYGFNIREFFFWIGTIFAKLCRSTLSYYFITLEVSLLLIIPICTCECEIALK